MVIAVAQWERRMIGVRTREGMAKSGKRPGRPKGSPAVGGQRPAPVGPEVEAVVRRALREGRSLRTTAKLLNEAGLRSPRGGRWHATTVGRLIARLGG